MPKAKAPRHLGCPNEIELQELIDSVDGRSLGRGRCGRRQFGLEWITGNRRSFEDEACLV